MDTPKTPKDSKDSIGISRRGVIRGLSVGLPVVATLTSRPAIAAVCSPSGFVSYNPAVNPSGVRHFTEGCGGFSPGAWGNPDSGAKLFVSNNVVTGYKAANSDGNRDQWDAAGVVCSQRHMDKRLWPESNKTATDWSHFDTIDMLPPTSFGEIFGDGDTRSLLEIINDESDQEKRHSAAAYLNASYFGWGKGAHANKMSPQDVVDLYVAYITGTPYKGVPLPNNFDLVAFIEQTYH